MIITTELAVAFACPDCGKLLIKSFSFFELNGKTELNLECECGSCPCVVSLGTDGNIFVDLLSTCCEESHEFSFFLDEFHEDSLFGLVCDTAKMGLGFIGTPAAVLEASVSCRLPMPL